MIAIEAKNQKLRRRIPMDYFQMIKNVLDEESQAILRVKNLIKKDQIDTLINIFNYIKQNEAELVVCGVGKSGVIGQKLVSTYNSIGLRSSFLHPVEALHGDLGRLRTHDVLMVISKSGNTEEIVKLIPYLSISKKNTIGLLGDTSSKLASSCALVMDCSVTKEACINNQAPTTSSTVALAIGDSIAVAYEHFSGLSKEGFATNHPGGLLGKSLRLKVEHLMIPRGECAILSSSASFQEVVIKLTEYPTGLCAIENGDKFSGIIVDGDIRRAIAKTSNLDVKISDICNSSPISIEPNDLALDALKKMENRAKPISVLPVVHKEKFLGVLRLHDLMKEGLKS